MQSTSNNLLTAVITDSHLLFLQGNKLQRVPLTVKGWNDLCNAGITHHLRNIWIVPGSDLSLNTIEWEKSLPGYDARMVEMSHGKGDKKREYVVSCHINRLVGSWDEKRAVNIFVPELDSRWNSDKADGWSLADVEDAVTLLGALHYLQDLLGVDIGGPGWTGVQLMKKFVPGYTQRPDLSMLPYEGEEDILFTRPLTDEEQEQGYIHVYDRNSMYLAAGTGAELGHGTPVHTTEYNPKLSGKWQIVLYHVPDSMKGLPLPVPEKGEVWAVTPVIEFMRASGYDLAIVEGYIWEKSTRLLQPWAKHLWDTRQELKTPSPKFKHDEARKVAYEMVKFIATRSVGRLDMVVDREKAIKPLWHRPDYKDGIVGLARARMFLKLKEILQQGKTPCLIYTDAIAFVSNNPDPRTAISNLMIRETGLGGFKHEMTLAMSPEVIDAFSGKYAAWQVKHILNTIGGK